MPEAFDSIASAKLPPGPLHLAIGMFDGVHLGHQSVIESAIHSARRSSGSAGVLTFNPHPSRLFRPESPTLLIMPLAEKVAFLSRLGVDAIITQPFTPEFAAIEASRFLPTIKEAIPQLAAVYVGENFRFGRGRAGDIRTLVREAQLLNLEVFSARRIKYNGRDISSTRIREKLADGKIEDANALLGYTYYTRGVVQAGRQMGRQIGFPTLNVPWQPELRPRFGVYAVTLTAENGGRPMSGVANYGVRPTVEQGSASPLLEVHLFQATSIGPGTPVRVEWHSFIRSEKKFASVDALRRQIAKDKDKALVALGTLDGLLG